MPIKVLFIGGTGVISSACSDLALASGLDLTLLTRGSSIRPLPAGARVLTGDINDSQGVAEILEAHQFDVIVNWIVFTPEQARRDIDTFKGLDRTNADRPDLVRRMRDDVEHPIPVYVIEEDDPQCLPHRGIIGFSPRGNSLAS